LSACINTAFEQRDGTIHADGAIAARDVKASSDPYPGGHPPKRFIWRKTNTFRGDIERPGDKRRLAD